MNFTCDNCQKRYSIADEKVRGKTVKVRCKNCQNVITVEGPAEEESTRVVSLADVERIRAQERSLAGGAAAAPAPAPAPAPVAAAAAPAPLARPPASAPQTPWDDEPTRTAPPRQTAGAPWFVMVRNKQEGPLDESAVAEWMAAGTISARSFFWRQGMPDWKRGSDIPELAALLAPAAPPEPPPPPPEPPPAVVAPPARAAPARREPEPQQPFYAENEPAPSEDDHNDGGFERDGDEDEGTLYGDKRAAPAPVPTPAPRRAVAAPADESPAASGAPLNELFSDLDLPGNRGDGSDEEDPGQDETREDPRNDEEEEDAREAQDSKAARKRPVVPARRGSPLKVVALVLLLLIVLPAVALFGLSAAGMLPPALADMVNKVTGKASAPAPAPRQATPAPGGAAKPATPPAAAEPATPPQGAAAGGEATAPAEGSAP
ncbi:GYF domain-containing protein [Corallococcus sp. AS-1-12]|uniref:GYF domain-containing protein n=1 Tax=Corallococcus sp. AS-1-12 TaxID=2874598 RepID=UPI001CBB634C|nr:GYF domain-containing protein [Corallococcus sp. AS-1-12]MBZ4331279.1 zinc-ribbon domain-containing protein [Corallococcus sp. AS-1-12]